MNALTLKRRRIKIKKTYYKLTAELEGQQYSFYMHGTGAGVEYKVSEWVEAPKWLAKEGYHLFVFNNLKNVKNFIEKKGFNKSTRLWLCEIEGKFDKLPHYISGWNLMSGSINPSIAFNFPKGTVMARKVKLIKLISGVL